MMPPDLQLHCKNRLRIYHTYDRVLIEKEALVCRLRHQQLCEMSI